VLAGDAFAKPLITIRSYDLKGLGNIASYHERD